MELALGLPFVAAALLLVVQVLLVAHGQLLVDHLAREAARAAAVDADPAAASRAVAAGSLDPARTDLQLDRSRPGLVTVQVVHRYATDVPVIGRFVPNVTLAGEATFRVESLPP